MSKSLANIPQFLNIKTKDSLFSQKTACSLINQVIRKVLQHELFGQHPPAKANDRTPRRITRPDRPLKTSAQCFPHFLALAPCLLIRFMWPDKKYLKHQHLPQGAALGLLVKTLLRRMSRSIFRSVHRATTTGLVKLRSPINSPAWRPSRYLQIDVRTKMRYPQSVLKDKETSRSSILYGC